MSQLSLTLGAGKHKRNGKIGLISSLFILLIAIPFACFSLFMAVKLGTILWQTARVQTWEKAAAEIIEVEFKGSDRDKDKGPYQVIALYQYSFEGKEYESRQVGVLQEPDNFDDFHKKLYKRLKESQEAGQLVDCYVNSFNASEAVLDRTARIGVMLLILPFVIVHGFIGFGFIISVLFQKQISNKLTKLQISEPDRPWLWREEWKQGAIKSSFRSKIRFRRYLTGALLWNGFIGIPVFIKISEQNPKGLQILLFPGLILAGIGLLVFCFYLLARSFKYGESIFQLAEFPAEIGRSLSGVVIVSGCLDNSLPIKTELRCIKEKRNNNESGPSTILCWSDERFISQTLKTDSDNRIGIPVSFYIPADSSETTDYLQWLLQVRAKSSGINYYEEFEVPVFRTKREFNSDASAREVIEQFEYKIPLETKLANLGVHISYISEENSTRYEVYAFSRVLQSVILFGCLLIFGGAGFCMFLQNEWLLGFGGTFSSLICFYAFLDSLLSSSDLFIQESHWTCKSGWYGFRGDDVEFHADEIDSINFRGSVRAKKSENGFSHTSIMAKLKNGKSVLLVSNFTSHPTERDLLANFRRRAGLV